MANLEPTAHRAVGLQYLPQELFDAILDRTLSDCADTLNLVRTCRGIFAANYERWCRKYMQRGIHCRDRLVSWAALRGVPHFIQWAIEDHLLEVDSLVSCFEVGWFKNWTTDPDCQQEHVLTLLHFSIIGGQTQMTKWLLEEMGADPTITGRGPTTTGTPITTAIIYRSHLAMHLASFWRTEQFSKDSSLYQAIEIGNTDIITRLCERGADVNEDTSGYGSPLTRSVEVGRLDVAKMLLTMGVHANAPVSAPRGPRYHLHRTINAIVTAALALNVEMMRLLISHGADVNQFVGTDEPVTPLCVAIQYNAIEAANLLLEFGARPDVACGGGLLTYWSPYVMALQKLRHVARRNTQMLDLLVANGADPNQSTWCQPPAVFLVMRLGIRTDHNADLVHRILDHGIDVNAPIPPQMYSQFGTKMDLQSKMEIRWTALHDCLMHPPSDDRILLVQDRCIQSMVSLLLDHGADPLAGYRKAEDMPKTPLGVFLGLNVCTKTHGHGSSQINVHEYNLEALLCFLSHSSGSQSTIHFDTSELAHLLGIVALIPSSRCRWYGPTRRRQIERFAEATCVGTRATQGKDAWLATLLKHPRYWAHWEASGRRSEVYRCLREGAGKMSREQWEDGAWSPSAAVSTGPVHLSTIGKRQHGGCGESEDGPFVWKRPR